MVNQPWDCGMIGDCHVFQIVHSQGIAVPIVATSIEGIVELSSLFVKP